MIQERIFLSPGSVFTGSVSSISNSRHKDITVLLLLVGTTSCKQNHNHETSVLQVGININTLMCYFWIWLVLGPGVTYSAVFTQHPECRRKEPVEELQQQWVVVWALQNIRKRIHPGDHEGFPAQLRWLHVDHATSTDSGRLQWENQTLRF